MSQNQNDGLDLTDPFGLWRTLRDTNLDAWAKGMTTIVGTDAFARVLGAQIDAYLATSAPFLKAVEQYMEAYLNRLNMPARTEVVNLAQRMTNIEMRLDDLDAKLDQVLHTMRAQTPVIVEMIEEKLGRFAAPEGDGSQMKLEEHLQSLDSRTEQLIQLVEKLQATAAQPAPAARRPRRKGEMAFPIDETPATPHEIAEDRAMDAE